MRWLKSARRPVAPFVLGPECITRPGNCVSDDISDDYSGSISMGTLNRLPFHFRPIIFFFGIPAIRMAIAMLLGCGFPSCINVEMFFETVFFDLPFLSGMEVSCYRMVCPNVIILEIAVSVSSCLGFIPIRRIFCACLSQRYCSFHSSRVVERGILSFLKTRKKSGGFSVLEEFPVKDMR